MMSLVGSVVGPLSESSGGSTAVTPPADGSDFAVNDLFFKVQITDETPYQRATAQFRKDQYDTGQSAGDQSLTGWWTRGQFSFHKGAGVTYYEVSEGETVLNRYMDASGLDPFDPGKVTCQLDWSGETSSAGLESVQTIGGYLLAYNGSSLLYSSGFGLGSTYTPASQTVNAFTVAPGLAYVTVSDGTVRSFDPATATETTLYNGLTTTADGIWYVKSRLLVADSDGAWYQLATNPDTPPNAVASTDVVFTATEWVEESVVCDTPGPILIGNGNRVFALTLDATGTIPTLSAPVQVAELPPGETISGIAAHLGFVVLVTGAGVRVAVVADSGQLTYGPLLVERATATTTFLRTSIGRYGTRVSVVVDNTIYEIDLSEQIGQGLEFAYTGRGTPFNPAATTAGVTTLAYSTQVAWQNDAVFYTGTDLMSGSVTTGYHRFATLEPKRFDSVRVHASGTAGTITVYKVDSNGAETSLYVMDVSQTHVEEIPFRFTDGQEMVALKFVLAPDAGSPTVTPVLLGYQIRALPEPQRQRMIRVPLMVKDVERRQPGRAVGSKGSAWERYRALEDLENAGSIVTFADYRTGESGRAYVESVELTNKTPPSSQSSGFGGIAWLTLRKL